MCMTGSDATTRLLVSRASTRDAFASMMQCQKKRIYVHVRTVDSQDSRRFLLPWISCPFFALGRARAGDGLASRRLGLVKRAAGEYASEGFANSFSEVTSLSGFLIGVAEALDSWYIIIGKGGWIASGLLKSVGVVLDCV